MPGLSRPYSNWSVRQMSRYVPEVSGYTDHPHAPLGTNLSTPSRGKLPRLLSRGMFTMSIRDNAISNFFIYFSDLSRLFWFSWYQVTLCVFGLPGILQARAMYTWPEVIWTFQEDSWQFVTTRRPRQQLAWAHKEESWIDDDDNKKDLLHPMLGWVIF